MLDSHVRTPPWASGTTSWPLTLRATSNRRISLVWNGIHFRVQVAQPRNFWATWSHHSKCRSHWIHVNCLNSLGRFHPFSTISTYSIAYHDKTWSVLFQKQVRYMFNNQKDFELQLMTCTKFTNLHIVEVDTYKKSIYWAYNSIHWLKMSIYWIHK